MPDCPPRRRAAQCRSTPTSLLFLEGPCYGSAHLGALKHSQENKTIIFDNPHQYHLHFHPAQHPSPSKAASSALVCVFKRWRQKAPWTDQQMGQPPLEL